MQLEEVFHGLHGAMMRGFDALIEGVKQVGYVVDGLYMPTPSRAAKDRRRLPETARLDHLRLYYDPDVATEIRGPDIWSSRAMTTEFFTLHNAWVQIAVTADSVVAGLGDRLLFTVVLEGSDGGPYAELASATVTTTGRTQVFTFPVLGSNDLSGMTRVVVYAADNANYTEEQPWVQRFISCKIDCLQVAGLQF